MIAQVNMMKTMIEYGRYGLIKDGKPVYNINCKFSDLQLILYTWKKERFPARF